MHRYIKFTIKLTSDMRVTDKEKITEYYNALLEKNEKYTGVFYAGVKTTGIFCLSICRARKPKKANVEFFTTFKDALDNGYRPCKVCKPTEHAYEMPADIKKALQLVLKDPSEKVADYHLKEKGLSPEKVRRWFQKHYGMTFHGYQRMLRINYAYQGIKNGKSTTETAFDSGYDSLSGFGYTFKKMTGRSPQKSTTRNIIHLSRLTTPLGPMFAGATHTGLCLLEFVDRRMLETEFGDLQKRLNATILAGENEHILQTKREITEYFAGQRKNFEVQLDTPGTDFQQSVWNVLKNIPYATTCSYQHLAQQIGRPKAVRAVAAANGHNRIAIIIPCHRVIGKDGSLTGYGGGLERKRWLIDHEKNFR